MNTVKLIGLSVIALVVLLNLTTANAVPVPQLQPRMVAAPPLQEVKATATGDLGLWEDVFVPRDRDFIVLRRGDEIFSLSMEASAKPKKLAKTVSAGNTQIVAGMAVDEKFWLFLNSSKAEPCAVEAHSGTVVSFEIPGLKVPGSQAPGIQSIYIVPHANAALVPVSGGDPATWPRDGTRPIYFWMDLNSGKTIRLPISWDLDYFSADERIAVFGPGRAIDMKTGNPIEMAPNRRKECCIPFDWTDTQQVKPLYERREGKGDADYFAGMSVDGRVLPVALGLEEVRYMSMAKADDGFAGFRLRHSGASRNQPSPLWIVPFKDTKKTESIAADVTDFTMLGYGNTIYVTVDKEVKPALSESRHHAEAFFYAKAERSSWNVLEGVERLPKLAEALAEAGFVQDRLRVRLIEGFGTSKHPPVAICLFEHQRADSRAFVLPSEGPALKPVAWHRAILVDRDGKRFLMPLFREGNLPDGIWLHNSGKMISGTYVWTESKGDRIRRIQLSERMTQKP